MNRVDFSNINNEISNDIENINNVTRLSSSKRAFSTSLTVDKVAVQNKIAELMSILRSDISHYESMRDVFFRNFKNVNEYPETEEGYLRKIDTLTELIFENTVVLSTIKKFKDDIELLAKESKLLLGLYQSDMDNLKEYISIYKTDAFSLTQVSINFRLLLNKKYSKKELSDMNDIDFAME